MGWGRMTLIGLVLACAGLAGAQLASVDPSEALTRALDQYARALEEPDRGKRLALFAQAEYGFSAAVEAGAKNAAIQVNLGNAAFQAEHVGEAVLAYHRALRFDSETTAASQNLAHIRSRMPEWVPARPASEDSQPLLFYRRISPADRSHLAALFFALSAASLAISVRRREGAWRGLALTGGLAWALLLASTVFDAADEDVDLAVITAEETFARSADSRLAALAYPEPLPSGVEVEILEERAEWTRVRLQNSRDVWVRGSNVSRVID